MCSYICFILHFWGFICKHHVFVNIYFCNYISTFISGSGETFPVRSWAAVDRKTLGGTPLYWGHHKFCNLFILYFNLRKSQKEPHNLEVTIFHIIWIYRWFSCWKSVRLLEVLNRMSDFCFREHFLRCEIQLRLWGEKQRQNHCLSLFSPILI